MLVRAFKVQPEREEREEAQGAATFKFPSGALGLLPLFSLTAWNQAGERRRGLSRVLKVGGRLRAATV